jgi:hypothetical protein
MTLRPPALETLLLCSVVLTAHHAHAQPTAAEISTARRAFESAVALEADQKWIEATLKLRQALAVKDTPGLRFHLAHCEEKQNLLVEASLDYDRSSELLRQGAKAPDVQKLLIAASAELKPRIPQVIVEMPSEIPSPVAELDGKAYAPSELALGQVLNPGAHRLRVSAAGHRPFERSFSVREGDRITIRAELQSVEPSRLPVGAALAAPSAQSSPSFEVDSTNPAGAHLSPSPKVYLMLGESAIVVAGLALGISSGVAESSARDRVQTTQRAIDHAAGSNPGACTTPEAELSRTCADLRTAIDDHDRDRAVSTVGFACAGVGAAALLATWLVYPSQARESTGPLVQPVVSLGRVGVQGRF